MYNFSKILLFSFILKIFSSRNVVVGVTLSKSDGSNHFEKLNYCMRQMQHPNLRECIGRTALNFLQRFDEADNFTLTEEFVSKKDDKIAARSLVNFLDADPVDLRGIMENAGAVFSQRNLEWHMDGIYPGLMLKIGPSADTNSVAEFVLDPDIDQRHFSYDEPPSTARVLAKQYLLPFLLGLKFNLVALVPLLFAFVCLLLKKSLFFAKLAIWVSGVLGVGGSLGALGSLGGFGGLGGLFGGGGGHFGPPLHGYPHAFGGASVSAAAAAATSGGYFPGKTTVFNQHYDVDEFHHNSPYKRDDRKVSFDKPREYVARSNAGATTTTRPTDRFYDYEKQIMMHEHGNGKIRTIQGGKLGPSAFENEDEIENVHHNFKTNEQLGWKAIDVRV